MPSANPVGKMNEREFYTEPVKQAVIAVEHKIRNLEKRKGKLDQYRGEQDQGKELNADQLAAVAKYSEVIQQLDFAREMVKQLNQLSDETKRLIKKEQKREIAEKALAEVERCRLLFLFQSVLAEFRNEQVVQDFLNGAPGTVQVTMEDLADLNVLFSMLPSRRSDPNFKSHVAEAAEHASMLLDGKSKDIGHKSYKQLKDLLLSVSECEYFLNRPAVEVTPEEPSESVPPPSSLNNSIINESVPVQVVPIQESTYSFLQESQIDIESPHMDPAVVAVSSFLPPPISQNSEMQRSGFISSGVTVINENHGRGGGDCTVTIDDEINEWDSKTGTTFINSESKEALVDGGDHSNRFGTGYRGGFRGGRGFNRARGTSNGYGRGAPRGGGNREYPNERMGYYRSEYEPDYDNEKEFRNRNGNARGFRRGNGQSNNNPRGNGGGYRGPRPTGGQNRQNRTDNGVTTECY